MALPRKLAVRVQEVAPTPPLGHVAPIPTALLEVVPGGTQTIAAGADFDFKLNQPSRVIAILVDVPPNVDADLELDGQLIQSRDRKGLIGALRVGDYDGRTFLPLQRVRLSGTNVAGASLDVRCWLVVLA